MVQEIALILDFGSQVTQRLARRAREAGVYSEMWPFNKAEEAIASLKPKAIILSGGPDSVYNENAPRIPRSIYEAGIPMLFICYSEQLVVHELGGKVEQGGQEGGETLIRLSKSSPLTNGLWKVGGDYPVWMSHCDRVVSIPFGFETLASSEHTPHAIIADEKRRLYGVQFHLEVEHTRDGALLMSNFLRNVAGFTEHWSPGSFRHTAVGSIRRKVGSSKVICALSGGVDSSVAAVLLHEAIGDQLTCVFVDNGLLRLDEAKQVVSVFRGQYNIPLVHVDASERFFKGLEYVIDPEQKRKIIGKLFIDVFEEEANKIGNVEFLAQGTLYPDVIESVSFLGGPSVTIKSHHNVGGLPEKMNLKLVEPLRELFKDEVRELGRELGIPEVIVGRHPFPGPGLGIRVPGEVTRERVAIVQHADYIFLEEIRNSGFYDKIWQAFAVLLPGNVAPVGVMGDRRTVQNVIWLRAVSATDGMTAKFFRSFEWFEVLDRTSTRITNEVPGINRVGYDITSKPPGTIEWE